MKATDEEIAILLERSGIAPTSVGGSRSKVAAQDGVFAAIVIQRNGDEDTLTVTVHGQHASVQLPADEGRLMQMIETLRSKHAIPIATAFEHMLLHLLQRVIHLYAMSSATELVLAPVHLHGASYHIDKVVLYHDRPLHLKARIEKTGRDSTFTHTGAR